MSTKTIVLTTRCRGKPIKRLPDEVTVPLGGSVTDIYHRLAAESGLSIHRLRVTKGIDGTLVPNSKDVTVASTGLRDQSSVFVKDLGAQISWRTVFIVEYLGPILIHPLIYFLRPTIYKTSDQPSQLQTLTLLMVTSHFIKRELETMFVHRFSLSTMPAFYIVRNSAHYWFLSGLNFAAWIYYPRSPTAGSPIWWITYPALALFVLAEFGNLSSHLTLRNLRSAGGTERGIPQGFWFNQVTCPNYMFEVFAWLAIGAVARSWSLLPFLFVAFGFMLAWAKSREKRYRREFGTEYRNKRHVILPGVI